VQESAAKILKRLEELGVIPVPGAGNPDYSPAQAARVEKRLGDLGAM
jgi:hypothetical protein